MLDTARGVLASAVRVRPRPRQRPRGVADPPLAPAVAIVTSRQRLWQRHGADGVFAIERAVGDLVAAMAERGLAGTLIYVDDGPILGELGVLPAEPARPESVARTVRAVTARMRLLEEDVRYVLVLGGDGVVPFHRADNASPDGEAHVLSDHLYAAEPDMPLRPVRAVGRIPDGSLASFVGTIRAAAAAHRRLAGRRGPLLATTAFGYSASVWKRAARSVFAAIGDPRQLRLSPPLTHADLPPDAADAPRFRYFNLHGLSDSAHWFGQPDPSFPADYPSFPVALRPEDVPSSPGALVFSEACFGADLAGRGVGDSLALTCLAQGALGFVGSTGVAYGGLDGPLVAADQLAHGFWRAVRAGVPAGVALSAAKWRLVQEAVRRTGYMDAEDEKTVRSFVLYGDPSLVHQVPSVWAEDAAAEASAGIAVEWAGPTSPVGTVSVQPHTFEVAPPPRETTPDALVELVRRTVARSLPELAGAEAQMTTARLPGGMVSKAARTAGSDRAYVVTLSKCLTTGDGCCRREVVRVTVDGGGRIYKIAVSR